MTQETLEQVQKAGRLRLHPSLTDPNWLVLRQRRKLFQHWLRRIPHSNLCVLDVGGRIQPYRALLGNSFVRYLAIDVRQTPLVDVVARGEHLPLASEQFDLVFCTQVLEYIPDPQLVINEIYRTLKTGGVLLLSAPAVFPRDSDVEYWRFLPCALRKLLSEFSHVDVTPEGNSLDGLIRTLNVCLVSLSPQPLGRMFRISMVPLLNLVAVLLQLIAPSRDDRFAVNFSAWAQK